MLMTLDDDDEVSRFASYEMTLAGNEVTWLSTFGEDEVTFVGDEVI